MHAAVPPPLTLLHTHPSHLSAYLKTVTRAIARWTDRSDPRNRAVQDTLFNAGLFVASVLSINKWGHLLSV